MIKSTIGFRASEDLKQKLKFRSEIQGKTVSSVIAKILEKEFKDSPKKMKTKIEDQTIEITKNIKILKNQIKDLKKADKKNFSNWYNSKYKLIFESLKIETRDFFNYFQRSKKGINNAKESKSIESIKA